LSFYRNGIRAISRIDPNLLEKSNLYNGNHLRANRGKLNKINIRNIKLII